VGQQDVVEVLAMLEQRLEKMLYAKAVDKMLGTRVAIDSSTMHAAFQSWWEMVGSRAPGAEKLSQVSSQESSSSVLARSFARFTAW